MNISTLGVVLIVIAMLIIAAAASFLSFRYGYLYRKKFAELKIGSAEEEAQRIIDEANDKAEKRFREHKKRKTFWKQKKKYINPKK